MTYAEKLRHAADVIELLAIDNADVISVRSDSVSTRVLLRDSETQFAERFKQYTRRSNGASMLFDAEIDGVVFTGNEAMKFTTEEVVLP